MKYDSNTCIFPEYSVIIHLNRLLLSECLLHCCSQTTGHDRSWYSRLESLHAPYMTYRDCQGDWWLDPKNPTDNKTDTNSQQPRVDWNLISLKLFWQLLHAPEGWVNLTRLCGSFVFHQLYLYTVVAHSCPLSEKTGVFLGRGGVKTRRTGKDGKKEECCH